MAKTFQEMKAARAGSFTAIAAAVADIGGLQASAKTTREKLFRRAGVTNSGTLIHKSISSEHAKEFFADCKEMLSDDLSRARQRRLRFLTVIHDVEVMDVEECMRVSEKMRSKLREALASICSQWIGVVEFDLIDLSLLKNDGYKSALVKTILDKKTSEESIQSGRAIVSGLTTLIMKLDLLSKDGVLKRMSGKTRVLIHCHALVETRGGGHVQVSTQVDQIKRRLKSIWIHSHQVELKQLFVAKTLRANLLDISAYVTKASALRFGRGSTAETLDLKMARAANRSGRQDAFDGVEDARAYSVGEIKFYDQFLGALMSRGGRNDRRGYVIGSADKWNRG